MLLVGLAGPPAGPDAGTVPPPTSAAPLGGRPQPLEGKSGCELWKGTVSGNDPSVLVEVLVCENVGGRVTGQLQWSSLKSGYSIREIAGEWSKDRKKLLMHDTAIVVDKPNLGWKFCTVDLYDLDLASKTRLLGTYTASQCPDTASVDLSLVDRPAPPVVIPPAEPEVESPRDGDAESEAREPKPTEKASSCVCSTPDVSGSSSGAVAFAIAAVLVLWRRPTAWPRAARPSTRSRASRSR